ncbi:hypothetical protein A7X12_01935 [Sphingomonas sp. TDK1]|nr:hypothetical protein A7X12_01935 [Sphingomonas sp. TDK1]
MIPLIDFKLPSVTLGRVLLIDDAPLMRDPIAAYLERQECPTVVLDDPGQAMEQLRGGRFGMVLLNQQLKDADGMDVLRRIRDRSEIPVIVMSNQVSDDIDRILAFELGADDYLTWPFHPRELVARARAIVRRQELGRLASGNPRQTGGYRFLGWELRCRTRSLRDPKGRSVPLTKGEYALLTAFLEAPQRVLSRAQLLQSTRTHEDIFDRSVDVQVLRLRRKLTLADTPSPSVVTERGVGYRFDAPVERLY